MQYKDLDLKHLREVCDIDFAHYTYKPNQCSCCYGPLDLPSRYWRNGKKPPKYVAGTEVYDSEGNIIGGKFTEYEYILFKNANNGSGSVTRNDEIKQHQCIEWNLSKDKLNRVIKELQSQLGKYYKVIKPKDEHYCIEIFHCSHNTKFKSL